MTLSLDPDQKLRILFMYWGRRGALPQFTLQLGHAALAHPHLEASISVSRQNEMFANYAPFGDALLPVDTFATNLGGFTQAWRLPGLRHQLAAHLRRHRIEAVVDLMPHFWSPLVAPAIRRAGVRYVPIAHDADAHPGDQTTWVKSWIDRSLQQADLVLTLSEAVADRLVATNQVSKTKLASLFLPDLVYRNDGTGTSLPWLPAAGQPFRLLFLGRIMPYKGLGLFLDCVDILRGEGFNFSVGVCGEGALGADAARLAGMGAEVINRWLSEAEIGAILARHHAVVLSHTEASQSGVAAAAFGAGLPVIATPVGGLIQQVEDGRTGILASRVDAPSLAAACARLIRDPALYAAICAHIAASRQRRTMGAFVEQCAVLACGR